MIADVLYQAYTTIEDELAQFPEAYADMEPELHALCLLMQAYQEKIDNPYTPTELADMQLAVTG